MGSRRAACKNLQIRTADLDGEGDIDFVLVGKIGTKILISQLK